MWVSHVMGGGLNECYSGDVKCCVCYVERGVGVVVDRRTYLYADDVRDVIADVHRTIGLEHCQGHLQGGYRRVQEG